MLSSGKLTHLLPYQIFLFIYTNNNVMKYFSILAESCLIGNYAKSSYFSTKIVRSFWVSTRKLSYCQPYQRASGFSITIITSFYILVECCFVDNHTRSSFFIYNNPNITWNQEETCFIGSHNRSYVFFSVKIIKIDYLGFSLLMDSCWSRDNTTTWSMCALFIHPWVIGL